jgi:hypothetical protein
MSYGLVGSSTLVVLAPGAPIKLVPYPGAPKDGGSVAGGLVAGGLVVGGGRVVVVVVAGLVVVVVAGRVVVVVARGLVVVVVVADRGAENVVSPARRAAPPEDEPPGTNRSGMYPSSASSCWRRSSEAPAIWNRALTERANVPPVLLSIPCGPPGSVRVTVE